MKLDLLLYRYESRVDVLLCATSFVLKWAG